MRDHAVYGIDLNSREYVILADALEEGSFAVSQNGRRLAWQNGHDKDRAESISLMDLETGQLQTISAPRRRRYPLPWIYWTGLSVRSGPRARPLGRQWPAGGNSHVCPGDFGKQRRNFDAYERGGQLIAGVTVEDSRIHLNQLVWTDGNSYSVTGTDTIVCNAEIENNVLEGIGWYASQDRGKLYFVQLNSDIRMSDNIKVSVPKKVSYDDTLILDLKANTAYAGMTFYAYGNGRLIGTSQDFAEAVKMAYEDMGVVTDQDQRVLWNRVNRSNSASVRDAGNTAYRLTSRLRELEESREFDDGIIILDGRSLALNQILYFVDQGCPVAAFTGEGQYLLITGFDQFNVTLYNPESGESWKMGLNDASEYFQNLQNDFVCGLFVE